MQGLQVEKGFNKGSPIKPSNRSYPPKEADLPLDGAAPPVNSLGVGFDDEQVHKHRNEVGPPADSVEPLRRIPLLGKVFSKVSKRPPPPQV